MCSQPEGSSQACQKASQDNGEDKLSQTLDKSPHCAGETAGDGSFATSNYDPSVTGGESSCP